MTAASVRRKDAARRCGQRDAGIFRETDETGAEQREGRQLGYASMITTFLFPLLCISSDEDVVHEDSPTGHDAVVNPSSFTVAAKTRSDQPPLSFALRT